MNKEIEKSIGLRIQMRRRSLALSSTQLAKLIGISQQQLSRIENAECKISAYRLFQIAVILDTPINWFFQDCYLEKKQFSFDIHSKHRRNSKR
ncbi:helix-turn-helix domain-containing protein (plasmid) [Xenorhabdus stockiae]|uniref:helix-turn-helix domain-containing protein n=1 Tax=Xenorhabdus stockiae TaxID=351614 RepID=UPI003CFA1021